jgi:hypothetical protein
MRTGRPRIFTDAECADLWRRYKAGESVLGIGRALRHAGSSVRSGSSAVRRVLECTGGIAPAERHRSPRVKSPVALRQVTASGQSPEVCPERPPL